MSKPKPRPFVVIEVSGGVAENTVMVGCAIDVYIIDWDNAKAGDAISLPGDVMDNLPSELVGQIRELNAGLES